MSSEKPQKLRRLNKHEEAVEVWKKFKPRQVQAHLPRRKLKKAKMYNLPEQSPIVLIGRKV